MKNINSLVNAFRWIEFSLSLSVIISFFLPFTGDISPFGITFNGFFGKPELQTIILIGCPMILFLLYPILVLFENKVKVRIPPVILFIILLAYYTDYYIQPDGDSTAKIILSFLISSAVFVCGLLLKENSSIYKTFLVSLLFVPAFLNFTDLLSYINYGGFILCNSLAVIILIHILKLVFRKKLAEISS
jgi:hypothetical protein